MWNRSFNIFSASGAEAGISVLTLGRPAGAEGGILEETFDVQIMTEFRNCCIRRLSIHCLDSHFFQVRGCQIEWLHFSKVVGVCSWWSLFRVVVGLWAT